MIIRIFCVWMIKKIGYHTLSGEISAIMFTIYVMTFFNTGILLILADANFTQYKSLSWIPGFKGPFPDLTEDWYITIAPSLILTMFLNAIYPYMNLGIAFGTGALMKSLDQGFKSYFCCHKDKTTKCKTIQEYVNLYGAPEHVIS
jgi:hypothetical protein